MKQVHIKQGDRPRLDAKKLGKTTYISNKASKCGHVPERYTRNGACVICSKLAVIQKRKFDAEMRALEDLIRVNPPQPKV